MPSAKVAIVSEKWALAIANTIQDILLAQPSHKTIYRIEVSVDQVGDPELDAYLTTADSIILIYRPSISDVAFFIEVLCPLIRFAVQSLGRRLIAISVAAPLPKTLEDELKPSAVYQLPFALVTEPDLTPLASILSEHRAVLPHTNHASKISDSWDGMSTAQQAPIRIARYNLIVVDAIWEGAKLADHMGNPLLRDSIYLDMPWDERVLWALNSGAIDLAIYNDSEFSRVLISCSNIVPLMPMGYSMRGDNFFVLSNDVDLAKIDPRDWIKRLEGHKIVAPMGSDIFHSFCTLLNTDADRLRSCGIDLLDTGRIWDIDQWMNEAPKIVLGGQNIRYSVRLRRAGYVEVANSFSFPRLTRGSMLVKSLNTLFANKALVERLGRSEITVAADGLLQAFRRCMQSEEKFAELVRKITNESKVAAYERIVSAILDKSYGVL